jgi:anthranilate synthase component I
MKKIKIHITVKKLLADTCTPVGLYLKLRDRYPNSILLESSDYHGGQNSFSYICCDPIATIRVENETIIELLPGGRKETPVTQTETVLGALQEFITRFEVKTETESPVPIGGTVFRAGVTQQERRAKTNTRSALQPVPFCDRHRPFQG